MSSSVAIWRDRRGRLSALRLSAIAFLLFPGVLAAHAALTTGLGARPLNDLIHRSGYWALLFLLVTLAVTPLARSARLAALMDVRRMLGVGASLYIAAHFLLYVADQSFNLWKVASEIVLRLYLTIGFIALIGFAALGITSTDAMVRRLGGRRWQRLHSLIYAIALLALIHFFQQTKADVWVPTFFAGMVVWLIGYRLLVWRRRAVPGALMLLALTLIAAILTALGEALGIGLYYGVSPWLVLQSSLEIDLDMVRPAWLVFGAGLCVVLVTASRGLWERQRDPSTAPARAAAR